MNGVHDLGGMHGFGPVEPELDEPVFHTRWEARVFALTLATGALGRWNLDMTRSAREQMPPAEYLATGYYEHWLFGLERLLEAHGLVSGAELVARLRHSPVSKSASPAAVRGEARRLAAADVAGSLARRGSARVSDDVPARFRPGDAVLTCNEHPRGHTRLPRYARGRWGVIHGDHGVWVFPDANAQGQGRRPQHCYAVAFAARELWGNGAGERDHVVLDLFEEYLTPAGSRSEQLAPAPARDHEEPAP